MEALCTFKTLNVFNTIEGTVYFRRNTAFHTSTQRGRKMMMMMSRRKL